MTDRLASPDPSRCPLCGAANQCTMELARDTGTAPGPCWCMATTITPEALARIPAALRGQACVCQTCGTAPARALLKK